MLPTVALVSAQPELHVAQPVLHVAQHVVQPVVPLTQPLGELNKELDPSLSLEITLPVNSTTNDNTLQVELDYMAMYYRLDQVYAVNMQLTCN